MDQSEIIKSAESVIQKLHDCEINGQISWFYDQQWSIRIGDEINGWKSRADGYPSLKDAVDGLVEAAIRIYPKCASALASTHEVPVGEWSHKVPAHFGWWWFRELDADGKVVKQKPFEFTPESIDEEAEHIQYWSIPIPIPNTDGAVGLQEQEK